MTLIGNLNVIEVWGREQWSTRQPELDAQATEIASRLSESGTADGRTGSRDTSFLT